MRRRSGFNPKRKIAPLEATTQEARDALRAQVTYGGNPEHKRSPGDYGLTPPASPRPGKTLCDATRPIQKDEAETLLRAGIAKGMVSELRHGNFPQNIWALDEVGEPFEAQLENKDAGVYHGYPMPKSDSFRRVVETEWAKR